MNKRTLFHNTLLILLTVLLAADALVLFIGYKDSSDKAYSLYSDAVQKAAVVAGGAAGNYNLEIPEEAEKCSSELQTLCEQLDISYIYILDIDEKNLSEKYLSIGFNNDASEDFIKSRHIGDVVSGYVNKQQIDASRGKHDGNIIREKTRFDDTLICYIPMNVPGRIIGAEKVMTSVFAKLRRDYDFIVFLTLALTVFAAVSFAFVIRKIVSKPAEIISKKMTGFVSEHNGESKLAVKGSREFTEMSAAFNIMSDEISRYIESISELYREKHTREAELNIAAGIQTGLLPATEFICGSGVIKAYIKPAKEVGGDFYDYQIADNGDICFAIADVSGKGISAAIFMSRAITLLRSVNNLGLPPAKALESFNNSLADYNPGGLFITAFIAVYSRETGKLTYSNAGHNPPYIISDRLITLGGAHSMAAGVFKNVDYEEESISLSPGDALFLFTDGVNEAQNKSGEFFSSESLESILEGFSGKEKDGIISAVCNSVESFSQGAEQSDDITMLTFIKS